MAGDFDISDRDFEKDSVMCVTTVLNSIVVVTYKGKVYRMTPTLVAPTWERLPDVPM